MQPRAISSNKPDATQWQRALTLLDRVLEKTATERAPLLAEIETAEPDITPLLRKLLAAQARIETRDFLSTLPKTASLNTEAGAANARIGPFLLLEQIGSGGMGSVWKARYADENIKREVAVKLPALSVDATQSIRLRERFARERDFLAQLEHAHIARLYDAGISEAGHPYLALEYVRGERIDEHCDAKKLSIDERLQLFLQALDAVEFAHRQLVLHRDIKPGNILVDGEGNVKLLDFGVAKLLPNSVHAPPKNDNFTELVGTAITLAYAAPEQIVNGPLSTATDVYALGVVLFKLLTGSAPYAPSRDTRGALEEAIINALPPTLSSVAISETDATARRATPAQLRQRLRGDLEVIVAKALRKSVTERYATAAAFGDDLRRAIANEPITARPQTLGYRANRLFARHKVAAIASALGFSALVGTTGVAVWQASVANANAVRATKEAARVATAQKFFAGMFGFADPEKNKGTSLIDEQILVRAEEAAMRDFASDPETLSLVLQQIGDIYFRLGKPQRNLEIQRKRISVIERTVDALIDPLILAKVSFANALFDSADVRERNSALPTMLEAQKLALSGKASDETIVHTLCFVANQYVAERQFSKAREIAQSALIHAKATLLNPHPLLAFAYEAHATTAFRVGQFDEARVSFQKAIAIDETGRGRGLVDLFNTKIGLARASYEAAHYLTSQREALDAIAFAETQLGNVNANLTPARQFAIFAAERAGNVGEAKRLVETLLFSDFASSEPFRLARAQFTKGYVALAAGELDSAERLFNQAEKGLSNSASWSATLNTHRASVFLLKNDDQGALSVVLPTIDAFRAKGANSSIEFARAAERAAIAYARLGDADKARTLFADACKWWAETRIPSHPDRARCEAYLAMIEPMSNAATKADALIFLEKNVAAGRDDKIALLRDLAMARAKYQQLNTYEQTLAAFPLLQ
jgi:serine/threonine protein kinase